MTDIHRSGLIQHDYFKLNFKINNHNLSLELLVTIEIVNILEHNTQIFYEIYFQLPLPKVMCENIKKKIRISNGYLLYEYY